MNYFKLTVTKMGHLQGSQPASQNTFYYLQLQVLYFALKIQRQGSDMYAPMNLEPAALFPEEERVLDLKVGDGVE